MEVAAYVSVILACTVVLAERATAWFKQPPAALQAGDTSEALGALVPDDSERALVLALSPTCQYCKSSMPAFRQLVEQRDLRKAPVAILGVTHPTVPLEAEAQVLSEHDVTVDNLLHLDFASARIRAVPSTFLVDRAGKVLSVWQGQITPDRVHEVLAAF